MLTLNKNSFSFCSLSDFFGNVMCVHMPAFSCKFLPQSFVIVHSILTPSFEFSHLGNCIYSDYLKYSKIKQIKKNLKFNVQPYKQMHSEFLYFFFMICMCSSNNQLKSKGIGLIVYFHVDQERIDWALLKLIFPLRLFSFVKSLRGHFLKLTYLQPCFCMQYHFKRIYFTI